MSSELRSEGVGGCGPRRIQKVKEIVTHQSAAQANVPQRRQLVRSGFCLSWSLSLSYIHHSEAPFMPPFSLIQSVLSLVRGAQVSSGSFGTVSLYLSASLRRTAALNGSRTEVTVSVPLDSAFSTCHFSLSPLLPLSHCRLSSIPSTQAELSWNYWSHSPFKQMSFISHHISHFTLANLFRKLENYFNLVRQFF